VSKMRNSTCNDPTRPIRRVYNDIITLESSDDEDDSSSVPDFSSVRSALHRHRQTFYSPIPRSVNDVVVRGQWRKTWKGEHYLVHQDPQWGLLIYMSPKSAKALQKCDDLYVDGTFSVCPKLLKQILTIHGMYKDRVLPFVFGILQSKDTVLCREIFSQVARHVHLISGRPLNPTRFVSDFEMSLRNAIEAEFPNASVKCCYFHFC
jgi:MULE transposase domain